MVQKFENQATSQASDIEPPPRICVLQPDHSVCPSPPPSVGQLHILKKHGPISGTFYIDPDIPSVGVHVKARKKNLPHASFHTRRGHISLNLGTTGDSACHKANVLVSSRHRDINVEFNCCHQFLHVLQ
ncbi:hypothetical protein E4T56_gene990 [Termitomyces sp. T112]|nr:hypothetical protein E4T56_gene990 [Termitomyces sp. T112]